MDDYQSQGYRVGWSYFVTTLLGEDQLGPVPNEEFIDLVKSKVIKPNSRIHHPSFTKNRWVEAKKTKAFLDLREQMANHQAAEARKRKQTKTPPVATSKKNESPAKPPATKQPTAMPPESVAAPALTVSPPKLSAAIFQPRSYPGISIVIVIFYVVAALLVLSALYSVGSVIAVGLSGDREVAQGAVAALLISIPIIFSMLFAAVVNFATAQVLQLLIHVQENTQRTAHYTEKSR